MARDPEVEAAIQALTAEFHAARDAYAADPSDENHVAFIETMGNLQRAAQAAKADRGDLGVVADEDANGPVS